ncbi:hypothetical protein JCM11251_002261 [Rhodosporidiobolus azoricus]
MTTFPQHTPARFHYARLSLTPSQSTTGAIDHLSLLQLIDKSLREWYGTMGPVSGRSEVEVLSILPLPASGGGNGVNGAGLDGVGSQSAEREAVIRFPAAATHALLTALPLSSSSSHRLEILSHSADLQRVAGGGPAARGAKGYGEWVRQVKVQGGEGEEGKMVEG